MRSKPDANYSSGIIQILPNEVVTYLGSSINGFYYIKYKQTNGYALAAYLAPLGSKTFSSSISHFYQDHVYSDNDFKLNGFNIYGSDMPTIIYYFGNPVNKKVDSIRYLWIYEDFSISFSKSTALANGFDIWSCDISGPRGITVGIT